MGTVLHFLQKSGCKSLGESGRFSESCCHGAASHGIDCDSSRKWAGTIIHTTIIMVKTMTDSNALDETCKQGYRLRYSHGWMQVLYWVAINTDHIKSFAALWCFPCAQITQKHQQQQYYEKQHLLF
jgi:hypothetical protein